MSAAVMRVAQNLARNCGHAVFPCREDKRPTTPRGFKEATRDADSIAELWYRHPGPLIGVSTGEISGIDALDVDLKHDAGRAWWRTNEERLPRTRAYRTRSGGVHLIFSHHAGVACSAGKLAPGIDVRGDGGYVIWWFASGNECLDHNPPVSWPGWLLDVLLAKPAAPSLRPTRRFARGGGDRSIETILNLVATAAEGERNGVLFWSACRLAERVRAGRLDTQGAEALLAAAARGAGLADTEARATIRSAMRRAAS